MPRIESIRLQLTTGARGIEGPVTIRFNDYECALNRISGGTAPGESYEGEFFIGAATENCWLVAPADKSWDLKELTVDADHGDSTTHRILGPVSLEPGEVVDILAEAN